MDHYKARPYGEIVNYYIDNNMLMGIAIPFLDTPIS